MNYEDFLHQVELRVKHRMGKGVKTCIIPVMKNNSVRLDGLSILEEDDNISPAIYLNDFYQYYQEGEAMDDIVSKIIGYYHQAKKVKNLDTSFFTEAEKVRGHVVCRVINYEKNRELLGEIPYRKFLNLAIVYYCLLDHEVIGNAAVLIRKEHMAMWRWKEEELYHAAFRNTARLLPCNFMSMSELIRSLVASEFPGLAEEVEQEIPLYVLSNQEKCFGAIWMTDSDTQRWIGEKLGQNYYILPSSVHECMIIPAVENMDEKILREMVEEINETQVEPEEVLSDSIYRYDRKQNKLVMIQE